MFWNLNTEEKQATIHEYLYEFYCMTGSDWFFSRNIYLLPQFAPYVFHREFFIMSVLFIHHIELLHKTMHLWDDSSKQENERSNFPCNAKQKWHRPNGIYLFSPPNISFYPAHRWIGCIWLCSVHMYMISAPPVDMHHARKIMVMYLAWLLVIERCLLMHRATVSAVVW